MSDEQQSNGAIWLFAIGLTGLVMVAILAGLFFSSVNTALESLETQSPTALEKSHPPAELDAPPDTHFVSSK